MSSPNPDQALHGLACPRCGGMIQIPEGQNIVICPFCDLRSTVSGVGSAYGVGVRRYQAPQRIDREAALAAYQRFLSSSLSIARDCPRQAQVSEVFLVHLPFWAAWGRGVAWAFGQQQVGSGDHRRWESREKKLVRELSWNGPACEVGEFGVRQVGLHGCPLEPFKPDELHRSGMVFEPVGSPQEALETARAAFQEEVKSSLRLDRTAQLFAKLIRPRLGVLYYPMWVVRYLYRNRSFQVVIDAVDGQVLYGKAPGSLVFRAAALVGGIAAGSFISVDVAFALAALGGSSDDGEGALGAAAVAFIAGLGIMWAAYRKYRHGEHYEHHRFKARNKVAGLSSLELPTNLEEIGKFTRQLEQLK